jgi:hypothetical protein
MPAIYGSVTGIATFTANAISNILKEFYSSTVYEAVYTECFMLEFMEQKSVEWNGKYCVIPIHVGRNTGVGYAAERVPLPVAGQQAWIDYFVEAKYLYGRYSVTGPAMKAGGKSPQSFLNIMDAEMNGLKNDLKDLADKTVYSGNRVLGFLNEHKVEGGAAVWEFSGDINKVERLRALAGGLTVTIVRCDTLAVLGGINRVVNAVDTDGHTITLAAALDTSGVAAGFACAVIVDGDAAARDATADQPHGIFENLSLPTIFQVNRAAAGDVAELRSNIYTMVNTGAHKRNTLTFTRMQQVQDRLLLRCGKEANLLLISPIMRSEYANLFNQTNSIQTDGSVAKNADGGFDKFKYSGIEIKSARQCPRGLMMFLQKDSWGMYELAPLDWADADGSILSRVTAVGGVPGAYDDWEAFMYWYYQIVCTAPKENAILVGIDFDGAVRV